jgi:hypothetical protein
MVEGDYEPGSQTEQQARDEALEKLKSTIVDGAQSQW